MFKNPTVTKLVPVSFAKLSMTPSFHPGRFHIIVQSKDEGMLRVETALPFSTLRDLFMATKLAAVTRNNLPLFKKPEIDIVFPKKSRFYIRNLLLHI